MTTYYGPPKRPEANQQPEQQQPKQETCPTCGGSGTFTYQGKYEPITRVCGRCSGSGKVHVS